MFVLHFSSEHRLLMQATNMVAVQRVQSILLVTKLTQLLHAYAVHVEHTEHAKQHWRRRL